MIGVLLAVPAMGEGCRPEPEYGGKSRGQWMVELRTAGLRNNAAATALRAIGPAALPCLVGYVVHPPENTTVFPLYLADAFRALGRRGAPAVNELVRLSQDSDAEGAGRAGNALGAIPSIGGTGGLDPILSQQR